MGKKLKNISPKKNLTKGSIHKKYKDPFYEAVNHPSPASRSSETAVNFEEN